MGEVVLAEDPRLERRVAIKRLRSPKDDGPDSARHRARLRREARMLARLRHPAIVQVYELLTVDGEDFLVMEHVDGPDLRQVLDEAGPLPPQEVVGLAVRLTQGLEHAHRLGIVHRDLKTENVLLDADGEPRLADFGLARSQPQEGREDDRLTAEGIVLGTARAMAPEQIAEGRADHRTDLHALGVLLYEALTGRSPFQAGSRRATLKRVLTEEPPLLKEPGTPPALAELIAHLLEKDPALRPRDAGEVLARLERIATEEDRTRAMPVPVGTASAVPIPRPSEKRLRPRWIAAAAVVLGAFALAALLGSRSRAPAAPETLYVAVLPTEVEGLETEEAELLAFAVRAAAVRGLSGLEQVVVLGPTEVDPVLADRTAREVAQVTAADQVLSSEVQCDEAECWLELTRIDGATGGSLWSDTLRAPRGEPDTLAWATESTLAGSLDRPRLNGDPPLPPELVAEILPLRLPLGHTEAIHNPVSVFERLEELRRRFGDYLVLDLWQANAASNAFAATQDPAWLERETQSFEAAALKAPEDPRVLIFRVDAALRAGRLDAAEDALEELARDHPQNLRLDELRAHLDLAQDRNSEALARMKEIAERRPSWSRFYNLARMASKIGEVELARDALAELEVLAPNNPLARRQHAGLELKFGDLDRAAELYGELAAERPGVTTWTNLGVAHLLRRDASAALEALTRAHALIPQHPLVQLNLADAHSLAGNDAEATALYEQVAEGLRDLPVKDPQHLTTRAQAYAHLGRTTEAVADIEEALRLEPGKPSVRFEAALVYALVGDLTSARLSRQKALDLGYEERWFTLPPFDALR